MFFIALTLLSGWLLWRGTLFEHRWIMWIYVFSVLLAVVANQVGWVAAEVGRQPWIVHPAIVRGDGGEPMLDAEGFIQYERVTAALPDGTTYQRFAGLRTDDGVSKAVAAEQVAVSIVMFLFIYCLLGAVWLFILHRKIQAGPEPPDSGFAGRSGISGVLELAAHHPEGGGLADADVAANSMDTNGGPP